MFFIDEPYLVLNLWWSFPRKGATCGIFVTHVPESGLSYIKEQMKKAFELHKDHFSWALEKSL